MLDTTNQHGKQRITWQWLRGLLRVIDELDNADQIVEKIQESFQHYLSLKEVELYIVENHDGDTREQVDNLAG